MNKKYLAKIIAKDNNGLKFISACCFEAKIKIDELKYLKRNQIFLVFLQRFSRENDKNIKKINSVCKFEFVESVKSKNIDQKQKNLSLQLIAIDLLKNKWLVLAATISLIALLLVIYTPINTVFSVIPIPFTHLLISAAAALSIIVVAEIVKKAYGKKAIAFYK